MISQINWYSLAARFWSADSHAGRHCCPVVDLLALYPVFADGHVVLCVSGYRVQARCISNQRHVGPATNVACILSYAVLVSNMTLALAAFMMLSRTASRRFLIVLFRGKSNM
jgi:hypothetical protein